MSKKETFNYYRKIFMRDNYKCVYCDREMIGNLDDWLSLEIDHLKPEKEGGTDDPENLVTSCNVCNKKKSAYYQKNEFTDDRIRNITLIREHIQGKRTEEHARWVKAIIQYEYFLKNKKMVDDRKLKVSDFGE